MSLAALFLIAYGIILTLSPSVRAHSWLVSYRWEHWLGVAVWLAVFSFAYRRLSRSLPDRDPYLFPIAALLTGWGLMPIWRLSVNFGLRQTIWLLVCAGLFLLGLRLDKGLLILKKYKYIWLISGIILTALTFVFGKYPAGSGPKLWLGGPAIFLQPSEPLKLLLIIYLAAYLADHLPFSSNLLSLLTPTMIVTGFALVLILLQKDLGAASIILFLYAVIIYVVSNRRRVVLISFFALFLFGLAGYELYDVIRIRIEAWINPWNDPTGRSYQIIQSLIAVATGGIFGRGPGISSPGLVPIAHSDFIYAAICEENGLVGSIALILLISLIAARGIHIALRARNLYHRILAAGLTAYLAGQSLLIIAGNIRLAPLTGVTLPFLSYGGSSLLVSYAALLLLLIISNHDDHQPAPLSNPRPYIALASVFLLAASAAALSTGWWAIIRSEALQTRSDNFRRAIADRYVRRGSLLDRNGVALNITIGDPGNYMQHYNYPSLSPVVGYTQAIYGQAGLNASLDNYLRGIEGNPSSVIWWNHLLYGHPPPGLNVRTTLDIQLQSKADELLGDHKGAIVLLNAQTGEILVMASHPYFDANTLERDWEKLTKDTSSPLLNRSVQALYPTGTALAPFVLVKNSKTIQSKTLPKVFTYFFQGKLLECAQTPTGTLTWASLISNGCPVPTRLLAAQQDKASLLKLVKELGFYESPQLPLDTTSLPEPPATVSSDELLFGHYYLRTSPMQMALAAAALTSKGVIPAPRLVSSVLTPHQGWVILPIDGKDKQVFTAEEVSDTTRLLAVSDMPIWQSLGNAADTGNQKVSWYLGGTLPNWQGAPLAVCVLLEEDNPTLTEQIGAALLEAAMNP